MSAKERPVRHENFLDQLMREKQRNANLTINIKKADAALGAMIKSIPLAFSEGFIAASVAHHKDANSITIADIQAAWDKSQMKAVLVKTFGQQEATNVTIQ